MKTFAWSLAPGQLWQPINPWSFVQNGSQFGWINIILGRTPAPEVEQAALDDVGSYGRQIGHIGEALEVLLRRLPLDDLTREEREALAVFEADLCQVRRIKARAGR